MLWRIIVCILAGYALGNLNGAILTSHLLHNEDVRDKGSGNAGLANFFRNYGGLDTLIVFVVDAGKSLLACYVGLWLFQGFDAAFVPTAAMIGGGMSVIGHIFPVMWSLRGGKGILSGFGITLFFGFAFGQWGVLLVCLGAFLIALLLSRYVSLGSLVVSLAYPFVFWIFLPAEHWVHIIAAVISALAIFMHRGNIVRIFNGTERKLTFKKKKETTK